MSLLRRFLGPSPRDVGVDEGYARWAATYDREADRPLSRIEMRATLALLPDVAGRACLDVACGTGRYACLLRERGARVVGMDRSAEMLAALRSKEGALPLLRGDLRALPLASGVVELVLCTLALGHVAELHAAVAELARVLRPGGLLVASDFHAAAAAAGLRRTCMAGREELALPHHPHAPSDYARALAAAGLHLEEQVEATAADEPEAFRGGRRLRARDRDLPMVLALRARRPGAGGV